MKVHFIDQAAENDIGECSTFARAQEQALPNKHKFKAHPIAFLFKVVAHIIALQDWVEGHFARFID
eukprot:402427-Pelagomonas_calceolata.AAC.1